MTLGVAKSLTRSAPSHSSRSVELAELHPGVLDNRHLLLVIGRHRRIVLPREYLIMAEPGDRATFGVVSVERVGGRTPASTNWSSVPKEIDSTRGLLARNEFKRSRRHRC